MAEGMGKLGDFFLLVSDATAQLLLQRCEQGAEPEWQCFWQVADADWREEIMALRQSGEIVDDDCTLLAIRIRPESDISQRAAGLVPADKPAGSPTATQEKIMPRRSSIASLTICGLALAAVLGGGILGYNRFVKAQVDPEKPPEKPADKYEAFKKVLPTLQKELAAGEWKHVRLDDMKITAAGEAVTIEFRGVWLYEGNPPTDDLKRTLHTVLKMRSKALLKEQNKDKDLEKPIENLGYEERGIDPVKSPLPALRNQVVGRKELHGAVFTGLWYDGDGRLHLSGYVVKDHEADQKKLIGTLLRDPALVPATVLGTREPSLDLLAADYVALKTRLQADFAAAPDNSPLRRTRLDEVSFEYAEATRDALSAPGGPALVLHARGEFLADPGDDKNKVAIQALIATALNKGPQEALPKPGRRNIPSMSETSLSKIIPSTVCRRKRSPIRT